MNRYDNTPNNILFDKCPFKKASLQRSINKRYPLLKRNIT